MFKKKLASFYYKTALVHEGAELTREYKDLFKVIDVYTHDLLNHKEPFVSSHVLALMKSLREALKESPILKVTFEKKLASAQTDIDNKAMLVKLTELYLLIYDLISKEYWENSLNQTNIFIIHQVDQG